ncbi:M20/M25/M40 family metallo-hydrolase [Actinomadura harenae]|uniref:M20/M25/M40 family metallo-hydrolase n=1 Tax=Actinomadura harenae TaxID=2483351 RepID=A0A3M2M3R4_9ACTN|nr:M20/M25/M40 family metallo-hydrolase [Actinomadura harenae]RMI41768.1 M20/M25/M40 family metallo-hydrolase [Actinomadura harenae]
MRRSDVTQTSAEDEVVGLCRDLIRIDTSNPTSDERKAAEYVAARLSDAGIEPTLLESAPGRASVVARVPGADPSRGALLLHSHLDVVPADASEWAVDPFSGEIIDGYLWGRGAIDMKDTVAVHLAMAREYGRTGRRPARDLVFAFLADEEAGGTHGSKWITEEHRDLFDGVTEAIGEGGGFSYPLDGTRRLYPIENAQRGQAWLRLTARGRAGHGSSPNDENAVTALADTLSRIGHHRFPIHLVDSVRGLLETVADLRGVAFDASDVEGSLDRLGPDVRDLVEVVLRNSANPTMMEAGYQINVIPGRASAGIDGRFLPGREDAFLAELDTLLDPAVSREFVHRDIAMETPYDGRLVTAMEDALRAEDPDGHPASYCNPGGTDAKAFSRLGIRCFGFKGLRMPHDLDYARLFHGVDERVPVDGLAFGVRVHRRLLATC